MHIRRPQAPPATPDPRQVQILARCISWAAAMHRSRPQAHAGFASFRMGAPAGGWLAGSPELVRRGHRQARPHHPVVGTIHKQTTSTHPPARTHTHCNCTCIRWRRSALPPAKEAAKEKKNAPAPPPPLHMAPNHLLGHPCCTHLPAHPPAHPPAQPRTHPPVLYL